MDGIFFLVLAFLTMTLSIKLSYYGDALSKKTKLGSALIGGILIASITSLPELVTSISSVLLNNPSLSFGDILGSNIFNIFVLSIYNLYFFRKNFFKKTNTKYSYECILLLIEYLIIIISIKVNFLDFSTVLLIIIYCLYLYRVFKNSNNIEEDDNNLISYPGIKFFFCSLVLVVLSVLLTFQADKITHIYPKISSSTIGAILLGITTSLPEVVSTYTLLKINNLDMAISNMLGSNIFNFLILSLSDLILKNDHIYSHIDIYSYSYLIGGILLTILLLMCLTKKEKKKIYYIVISLIMSFIYLLIWYFQFK